MSISDRMKIKKAQGSKSSKSMIFEPENREVFFTEQLTVLDLALREGVRLNHSCGGMGSCGTCRVEVLEEGEGLSMPNDIELEMIQDRGFEKNERLACQIFACNSLRVKI